MEQRIHKVLLIVGGSIAFEILLFILYLLMRYIQADPSPFLLLSFFATYILMLFFLKRANIFNNTSFRQALLYALLLAVPVIVLPPVISLTAWPIITQQMSSAISVLDLRPYSSGLGILSLVKFIYAAIVAFIFCTRAEAIIGLTDEKELQLYGTTTQGVIFRKWAYRHLQLVKIEYHIDGNRYETDPKIDRKNSFSENDTVTVLYSTRYPYVSAVKEFDQNIH
jgi:hypothetical protein